MNKGTRRKASILMKNKHDECWRISLRYSKSLIKNINSPDLYTICLGTYSQYQKELSSKGLPLENKKYIQVWETMVNTVKKGEKSQMAVRLLHQTNCQRSL